MKRSECNDPFLRGYLDAALFTTDAWDRGYPDKVADPLTQAAHKFGEHDLCPDRKRRIDEGANLAQGGGKFPLDAERQL